MPRSARWWLVLATTWLAAAGAQAQVTWRGDFETGDTSQYGGLLNGTVMGRRYITVVSDLVAEGAHAGRVELHNDAVWPNGLKRVELSHTPDDARTAEGAELYFAWSIYLPEMLPTTPEQTIGYWESDSSYQQMMAFTVSGERVQFSTRRPMNRVQWTGMGAATAGRWHRIAVHVLWSTAGATGRVDVWWDGAQVVTDAAAQTLADSNRMFTQFGLLRGAIEFTDTPVIYVDDAIEGGSLADVRYDVLPGAMPDAGVAALDAGPPRADAAVALDAATPPRTDGSTARADAGAPTVADDGGCHIAPVRSGTARAIPLLVGLVVGLAWAGRRSRRRR